MSKKILLIVNPASGKGQAKSALYDIVSTLCAEGNPVTVMMTTKHGDATVFAKEYAEALSQTTGLVSCITDHDQVVAAAGQGSREYSGKGISKELEATITAREGKCFNANEKGKIPVVENQKEINCAQTIQPIICAGDAIGAVILMGKGEKDVFGNPEKMLVQTAAGFLGRQMEQ